MGEPEPDDLQRPALVEDAESWLRDTARLLRETAEAARAGNAALVERNGSAIGEMLGHIGDVWPDVFAALRATALWSLRLDGQHSPETRSAVQRSQRRPAGGQHWLR